MRRILIVALLLTILAAATWTLLRWPGSHDVAADPWRAVPEHAAVIIELPSPFTTWDRFTHTSLLWKGWEQGAGARSLAAALERAAKVLEQDPAIRSSLGEQPLLVALLRTGGQTAVPLYIIRIGDQPDGGVLQELLGMDGHTSAELQQGGTVRAALDGSQESYVALREGLLMLSTSAAVVEEGVLQLQKGRPLTADAAFEQARGTWGEGTDAHVILHGARSKSLLATVLTNDAMNGVVLPDGWIALDVTSRPDALLLSGLLFPSEPNDFTNSVNEQGAGDHDISRVLPDGVVQWEVRHVSDAELALRSVVDEHEELLPDWAFGPVGIATAQDSSGGPGISWVVIGTEDPDNARTRLLQGCETCDSTSHRGTSIFRSDSTHTVSKLLGRACSLPKRPWCAVLGNQVVMSDDLGAVRSSIDAWNDGNSLAENRRASNWFERMSDDAAFTWWHDPARAPRLFNGDLKTDSLRNAWERAMADVGALSLQVSPAQHGNLHVSIALYHAPLTRGAVAQETTANGELWSCNIQRSVHRTPDIVLNHTNNTREVLVQDTLHRIHLVSATGQELWTRDLDGPILGPVHQVDKFRNGKLQLLFNTARTCYLIDRNGKDLGGFPLALKSEATAPLSVFDYDGNGEYRLLVPTKDLRLLNFNLDGKAVEGWAPPKLQAAAVDAVHHLRIRNKDHLVLVLENGRVMVLDRKGNERERLRVQLDRIAHVEQLLPGNELGGTRIRWTDFDLAVHETTLSGEERHTANALMGRATYVQSNDDDAPEVLLSLADSIVLTRGNSKVFSAATGAPNSEATVVRLSTERSLVTVIDPSNGIAKLFTLQGTPVGPSLSARSPFAAADLNLDGLPELITVTKDGHVIAYRAPLE